MENIIDSFFNWSVISEVYPLLLQGLRLTVLLTLITVPISAVLGLIIAVLQGLPSRLLRTILVFYVDGLRALPPLVLLVFIYFGLPFLGVRFDAFTATVLALVLNGSSFFGEIFRAGLESVHRGQNEAARSTGLSGTQSLISVIIPQGTRNVLPDLITNFLELAKQTSLASVVGLQELLRNAQIAQGLTYNPTPLIAAALIYFLLLWPFVRIISRMQRQPVFVK